MNIVFMGTPEFAVPSLKAISEKHTIKAVITAPDKPAGRGKKLRESAVKQFAATKGIPVLQPSNLKAEAFLAELKSLSADLFVVVAFRMLPIQVWQMPPLGTINLHASLLPDYRGAAPINWALINGEEKTGLTTFYINEEIDRGSLIQNMEILIGPDTTAGELHDQMMEAGADLLLTTIDLIASGKAAPKEQQATEALKLAPKLHRDTARIRWNQPAAEIHNHIRGLSPYPGAFSELHSGEDKARILKIYRSRRSGRPSSEPPGSFLVQPPHLYVSCSDEWLEILEVQLEGRNRISAEAFLRGTAITERASLK